MKKKRIITICAVVLMILAASAFYLNRAAIFQRGNPIPYLISAIQISESNPYVAVDETKGIYISKRGECPELFDFFCEQTGMEFVEQAGSGYQFTDGDRNDVISSEVYWGRYTVWTIPDIESANREQNAVAPNKCLDEAAGNMTFYEEPVKEAHYDAGAVTVRLYRGLNEEQADKFRDILDDVDEWTDDHSVDRLAYYFDGDFELSDREHKYYFTYEYNVIYYDHYYAEIPAEDMQYIMDLGAVSDELPDIEPIEYTSYYNIEEQVELCKGTVDEKSKVTVKFQSTEGPSTFAVEVWHRVSENEEWTKSESKSAIVGDAPSFVVPVASEYLVMVTATEGNKGNVTFFVSCT